MTRPLLLALAALLGGCAIDFHWTPIVAPAEHDVGREYRWRTDDELWVFGEGIKRGATVLRRKAGTWSQLDLCGPYAKRLVSETATDSYIGISFDGDVVWALCGGDANDGMNLVRSDGTTNTELDLPADGSLRLVPMLSGLAIVGGTTLFVREGDAWKPHTIPDGSADPGTTPVFAGRGPNEIYVGKQWWDGSAWHAWAGSSLIELRDGELWAAAGKLSQGTITPIQFAAQAEVDARGLGFAGFVPPDVGIFAASTASDTQFWRASTTDTALTYLGSGPFPAGTMYGGGGVTQVYAIDEDTLLVHMAQGNLGTEAIMEGSR